MKAWMLYFLIIFLWASDSFSYDDNRDPDFEKRIHSIYLSDYSQIITDGDWSVFLDRVESESYTIRSGDTLWGLSKIFFGDGLYWSKVWSLNEKITNPHRIYPNAILKFFSGSTTQAPGVIVEPPAETVAKSESSEFESAPVEATLVDNRPVHLRHLYPGAPSLPPSKSKVKPVPRYIPSTFAGDESQVNRYDNQGMSFDLRPPAAVAPRLVPHVFIHQGNRHSLPHLGEVIEMENGSEVAGFGDSLYVKSESQLAVGNVVTVVGQEYNFSNGRFRGTVFRYMGELEITDVINGNSYKGTVTVALMPIETGSFLTTEVIPAFNPAGGNNRSESFELAGGAYENDRQLFGPGAVVFLGGGRDQGVKIGDIYGVYKNRQARFPDAYFWQSPQSIGVLKVFRVEKDMASAMVISASEEIVPGDTTGAVGDTLTDIGEGNRPKSSEDNISFEEADDESEKLRKPKGSGEATEDEAPSEDESEEDSLEDDDLEEDESLESEEEEVLDDGEDEDLEEESSGAPTEVDSDTSAEGDFDIEDQEFVDDSSDEFEEGAEEEEFDEGLEEDFDEE